MILSAIGESYPADPEPVLKEQKSFIKELDIDGANQQNMPTIERKPSDIVSDDLLNRSTGSKEQKIPAPVTSGQTERNSSIVQDSKLQSPNAVAVTRRDVDALNRSNRSIRGELLFEKIDSQSGNNISFGISPIKDTRKGDENRLDDEKDDSGLVSPVAPQGRTEAARATLSPSKDSRSNKSNSPDVANLAEAYDKMKVIIELTCLICLFDPINVYCAIEFLEGHFVSPGREGCGE